MFGFFGKRKTTKSASIVAFDLEPLVNSLSPADRVHFSRLADDIHAEIHRYSHEGWDFLMRCWVVKRKEIGYPPEVALPIVGQTLTHDIEYTKSTYEVAFPISKLNSVLALEKIVNKTLPQNDILGVISGECAVNILKKTVSI